MKNIWLSVVIVLSSTVGLADMIVTLDVRGTAEAQAYFVPTTDAFTATIVFKPEMAFHTYRKPGLLLCSGDGYFEGFRMAMVPDAAKGTYYPCLEFGRPECGSIKVAAPDRSFKAGIWHRMTATADGKTLRLFLDGDEVASESYEGGYCAPKDGLVKVYSDGALCGIATWPFLADSVRLWDCALSDAEVRDLGVNASVGDTPEVPRFLDRLQRGETFSAKELDVWLETHEVSALAKEHMEAAYVFGCLKDGDLAKAKERYVGLTEKIKKAKLSSVAVQELRAQFVDALERFGYLDEAIAFIKEDLRQAVGSRGPQGPYVAYRLMKLYERSGKNDFAEEAKRAVLSCDLSAYPHLKASFGRPYTWPAGLESGAKVSRKDPEVAFYVDTKGDDDSGTGEIGRPFATGERAMRAVRALVRERGLPQGGVAVRFRTGRYNVTKTLRLTAEDSGTSDNPIVLGSASDETAVLSGGFEVDGFAPVTDPTILERLPAESRGKVLARNLYDAGFPGARNPFPQYGFYVDGAQGVVELYENGCRLDPARFPNDGFLTVRDVQDGTNGIIGVASPLSENWRKEKSLMACGYWYWLWADLTTSVKDIDVAKGVLKLDFNVRHPSRDMSRIFTREGQKFYLMNAVCAIDRPGEWCIEDGVLYVWPKDARPGNRSGRFVLTGFDGPFVSVDHAKNVRIEGLVFEKGRRLGVEMRGCEDCVFAGNVVRNFGGNGMEAHACSRLSVEENVFHTFGHGALEVSGGDRRNLVHSGNRISGNEFRAVGLRRRTYAPHLHLKGIGTEVSYNHFHEAPSSAMRLEGNDFYIVSNLVENVLLESDDQGGVDIYRNASYWGNRYCWNVWRDIGRYADGFLCGQAAIRFDGNISGQTVFANRFIRCGTKDFGAINSCGGRLHVVDNNLFIDCGRGMSIEDYPLEKWTKKIKPSIANLCLRDVCITNAPYAVRYPGIATLLETNQVNQLYRNVTVGETPLMAQSPDATIAYGNLHFSELPDMKSLKSEYGIEPVPDADDVGPRDSPAFVRAKRNDCSAGGRHD